MISIDVGSHLVSLMAFLFNDFGITFWSMDSALIFRRLGHGFGYVFVMFVDALSVRALNLQNLQF